MQKITTFLMFEGRAEEAITFYLSLFERSEIISLVRHEEGGAGPVGKIMHAVFSIDGQQFMCIDSGISHGFSFTPAMSLFVNCESESELERLFAQLSSEGSVMMPLDAYGFSTRFGWVADRFGVSWQLNLP